MNAADWTQPAERELEAYLDYLSGYDIKTAQRARREIQQIADQTARMPGLARRSLRWRDRYERSVRYWKKLLVMRIDDGRVEVVAFLDTRRDLDAVDLPAK